MAYELDAFMTEVHFIDSEAAYKRLRRKLRVQGDDDSWVSQGAGATTHHWRRGSWIHEVICMGPSKYKLGKRALLAHECMHAVQAIRDQLNERLLSDETECWLLQSIFQRGMEELEL